jgi:hypothetical protein
MEVASPEAALSWIREIQAALFAFRNSAKSARFCIPLKSIIDITGQKYMTFSYTFSIVFDQTIGEGDAHDDDNDSDPDGDPDSTHRSFQFYAMRRLPVFGSLLRRAVVEAAKRPTPPGMPKANLSVAGLCDEEDLPERAKDRAVEISSTAARFREMFALTDDPEDLIGTVQSTSSIDIVH